MNMKAIRTRMTARSITEDHRVSSPLELLFDLTFVVAVGSLVVQLAHAIEKGHAADNVGPFLMVFFAIWWAWNQFTWLASAYDTDDVLYRVLTMVQMGGVLVLAAGVPSAFASQNFATITVGYLIMRLGLLGMLARAYREDPGSRGVSGRYIVGISVVQVGWLLRLLFIPVEFIVPSFIALAIAELLVAPWASARGGSDLAWHPHHIAERYGLFTIILLGESVLAVTAAVQESLAEGLSSPLVVVAVSGLVLLFAMWWLYFAQPAAEGLVAHRERSYIWGYGHYFIFASLAATGAGLEAAVKAVTGHSASSNLVVGYSLAIPVAAFLLLVWLLHAPIVDRVAVPPVATAVAVVVVLLLPLASAAIGMLGVAVGTTLVAVALLAVGLTVARVRGDIPAGER